jgi:hypothetical protein
VRVANREEPVVGIPVVVPPIEVEVPLGTVSVEIRHVAVTVDLSDGALYEKLSEAPLLVHQICGCGVVSNS